MDIYDLPIVKQMSQDDRYQLSLLDVCSLLTGGRTGCIFFAPSINAEVYIKESDYEENVYCIEFRPTAIDNTDIEKIVYNANRHKVIRYELINSEVIK